MMKQRLVYLLKHNLFIQKIYRVCMSLAFKVLGLFVAIEPNTVLFVSFMGSKFNDSPKAIYRTTYMAWYLRGNILNRRFAIFVKHIAVDVLTAMLIVIATSYVSMETVGWWQWILYAIETGCIAVAVTTIVNLVFYRDLLKSSLNLLLRKKRRM